MKQSIEKIKPMITLRPVKQSCGCIHNEEFECLSLEQQKINEIIEKVNELYDNRK